MEEVKRGKIYGTTNHFFEVHRLFGCFSLKVYVQYGQMEKKTIYVLALVDGRYYVGASNDIEDRMNSHFNGEGSAWTQKYKPLRVVESMAGNAFDEDKMTKQYMHQYGIDNVRGASYCRVELTHEQRQSIEREFTTIRNVCFKCGSHTHYANACTTIDEQKRCARCGRLGHTLNRCYAKWTEEGDYIPVDEDSWDSDSSSSSY